MFKIDVPEALEEEVTAEEIRAAQALTGYQLRSVTSWTSSNQAAAMGGPCGPGDSGIPGKNFRDKATRGRAVSCPFPDKKS